MHAQPRATNCCADPMPAVGLARRGQGRRAQSDRVQVPAPHQVGTIRQSPFSARVGPLPYHRSMGYAPAPHQVGTIPQLLMLRRPSPFPQAGTPKDVLNLFSSQRASPDSGRDAAPGGPLPKAGHTTAIMRPHYSHTTATGQPHYSTLHPPTS